MSWARTAEARSFDEIYTECGLGGMLMQSKPGLASCTNFTWDLGSTAISSNVSSPDTCEGGRGKRAALIHRAYPLLEREIARGQGQHLSTLIALAGCQTGAQPEVTQALREDLAALTQEASYSTRTQYQKSRALYERFNQRLATDFAVACGGV